MTTRQQAPPSSGSSSSPQPSPRGGSSPGAVVLGTTTTSPTAPSSHDPMLFADTPSKGGWLWKFSTGRSSFFGRKNWKMRYFHASAIDGIEYYASEPLTVPKGSITWDTVTHIYASLNSAINADASDPEMFYFGVRFSSSYATGDEKVLLIRTETPEERQEWTDFLTAAWAEARHPAARRGGGGRQRGRLPAVARPPPRRAAQGKRHHR